MTEKLFLVDAYAREAIAAVVGADPRGIVLSATNFYAQGGGQPGDGGEIVLSNGNPIRIVNTVYDADRKTILHVPAEGAPLPAIGEKVTTRLDWARRYARMRAIRRSTC
jgi:misacylated tRNA(Ala) deacylase